MHWPWRQHQHALVCGIFMTIGIVVLLTQNTEGHDGIHHQQLPTQRPINIQQQQHQQQHHPQQQQQHSPQQQQQHHQHHPHPQQQHHPPPHHGHGSGGHSHNLLESRSSYAMLSQAMSQAVSHEFSGVGSGSSAESACVADDVECLENVHDRLGMEAIRSLHQQLDDDDNGNIDLTESDDILYRGKYLLITLLTPFLREELKYDSGYEKRHKTFHYNDDTQISVKELWEAWLRSEVHNWTVEQTTDWLSQSVQLPQYVELFQKHKVSGETLPRLAVHNMHYVSTVLGIRDPIHKQKIALKAMDVVLFGPPRETGTRWKDYFLVTLLLSAIIGCWYAYQQNKNAKRHLRRMAKDMEGLQKAENALTEMQKELELARLEQENVATEKLDLERRLKEAPTLSSSSSDLENEQLKQKVEILTAALARAENELSDHCWTPPAPLQTWLQLTYELESKHTIKKRVMAEKQLQLARDACEKLRRKRSSLVGAFVSTHGKSIDDVDRSIVEARNALGEVTNELQERLQRWKQIESLLGFNIVNNNGLAYLENILYNRNGSGKSSRNRISGSQDELDDESVQGMHDNHILRYRDDSSGSDDGDTVTFIVGSSEPSSPRIPTIQSQPNMMPLSLQLPVAMQQYSSAGNMPTTTASTTPQSINNNNNISNSNSYNNNINNTNSNINLQQQQLQFQQLQQQASFSSMESPHDDSRQLILSQDSKITPVPRAKKSPMIASSQTCLTKSTTTVAAPMPPPRRANSHLSLNRPQGTDLEPLEPTSSNANTTAATAPSFGDTQLEDTYSTDSSSFDGEFKKRRRKLHFPFGKKTHKNKNA